MNYKFALRINGFVIDINYPDAWTLLKNDSSHYLLVAPAKWAIKIPSAPWTHWHYYTAEQQQEIINEVFSDESIKDYKSEVFKWR